MEQVQCPICIGFVVYAAQTSFCFLLISEFLMATIFRTGREFELKKLKSSNPVF